MVANKIQAIDRYLENLPRYRVAVMGAGLPSIHQQVIRAATPWDALRTVVAALGDVRLSQYGVQEIDEEPAERGKV